MDILLRRRQKKLETHKAFTPYQQELLGRLGFSQNDIINNEKLRDQKIKNSLKELSDYENYHTSYQIS